MKIFVTKANGSEQLYDREKVVNACLRMGATPQAADEVADRIEGRLHKGISTREILQMIRRYVGKHKPGVKDLLDLRKGLSLMSSKPEFEMFVQTVLAHNGFEVSSNQLLKGKCVEHEVDGIARKDGKTYFVEAKHHFDYHNLTGLDESRIARAVLEDVTEGFSVGKNDLEIDGAMIVTNTKFSDEAKRYGECRNILQIGWGSPKNRGLQTMIDEQKLYPLSCLKGLRGEHRNRLVNSGIVLIKQLLEENPSELARKARLQEEIVKVIVARANSGLNELEHS